MDDNNLKRRYARLVIDIGDMLFINIQYMNSVRYDYLGDIEYEEITECFNKTLFNILKLNDELIDNLINLNSENKIILLEKIESNITFINKIDNNDLSIQKCLVNCNDCNRIIKLFLEYN